MITPLDIQNKEFNKSLNGYRVEEVQIFLRELMRDYERCYKENIELKEKIDMLNDKMKYYDSIEGTLQNTLVVAQKSSEDLIVNSREKASQIIREAEIEANGIIESVNRKVMNKQTEYEKLREEIMVFKLRFKTLLKSELEALEQYIDENDIGKTGGFENE